MASASGKLEAKKEEEKLDLDQERSITPEDSLLKSDNNSNDNKADADSGDESTPPKNKGLIKAVGTYYPLTAFPTNMPQGPVMRQAQSPPRTEANSGKNFELSV